MDKEIIDNHKTYLERKALYKSLGYDVDKEREFILEAAQPVRGRILEAGTGKGHFALALARAGYSFVTFDVAPEEQRFARMNAEYFGFTGQVDFRIENGERTGFPDGGFDTVFSVNVLHHLQNPFRVIDELVRLVSPGGRLILADFTPDGFRIMDKIHSMEGGVHETGKAGLADVEAYLAGKGFAVRKSSSSYQCVLIAGRDGAV